MVYALIYILMRELSPEPAPRRFGSGRIFRGMNQTQLQTALDTLRKKIKRNTGSQPEDGFFFIQNPRDL